jgi:hypothetical protein
VGKALWNSGEAEAGAAYRPTIAAVVFRTLYF